MSNNEKKKQAFEETKGIYISFKGMSEKQKEKLKTIADTIELISEDKKAKEE